MNKVKAFFLQLLARIVEFIASKELEALRDEVSDLESDLDGERELSNDLQEKVFALERIKEALLEENKKLAEGFNRVKAESDRLTKLNGQTDFASVANMNALNAAERAVSKIAAEKQDLLVKLGIAEECLRDERSGHSVLNDTNRALEARLKVIMTEMFPGGHGMYIHYYDEKTRTSKPFKIPLKMQKQITKLLSPGQKKKVKKVKAADGNV